MHKIVEELITLIDENEGWRDRFDAAMTSAATHNVKKLEKIRTLDDYFKFLDHMVHWAPKETEQDPRLIYTHLVQFYFFLDQPTVRELQSPIEPGGSKNELTPLSKWIKHFADAWGEYLDTTDSAKDVASFKKDPLFNWKEYMKPPSGYLTFNQFFARHVKPGMRPIAGMNQDEIVVSPADCTFVGRWRVSEKSKIMVNGKKNGLVESKGLQWSIHELLKDSKYKDRFRGGVFTHSFLNSIDYHRWHAPVQGKVLESRVIQGQCYLDVSVKKALVDGKPENTLNAEDGTGYQFLQTRGLVVIDSPIGLVACIPMGMAQVSSIKLTAKVGVTLFKGEELGYFQFGGSDFVMVFERSSNIQLIGQQGVHVQQGNWIGTAFPYSMK